MNNKKKNSFFIQMLIDSSNKDVELGFIEFYGVWYSDNPMFLKRQLKSDEMDKVYGLSRFHYFGFVIEL